MKTQIPFILALLLAAGTTVRAATNDVLTVAVFDFESKDEAVRDFGPKVATLVNANLSAEPQIITVERAELEKVLGEHELGLSGTVNPDSAAKIGQLTGAKVLVTGRVFKADGQTIIVAKVIGTETSRVYGEMVQGGSSATMVDLSASLAKKIAGVVSEKSDTLVAKVETREERIAKIKQALAGRKLPVVSVNINERHYGPHIIDPAAQTELSVILQQCGFTLADSDSTNKPAIEISGDAFSAYGMQKGNLISCKSRIELKARDVTTGNILVVDRQTSVGVDIAEQTAAKTALENAADTLAERVIPKITR
ncbi:MAG: CsgG/HfaB family protein [Verrucomicrobiota bacterium]